MMKLFVLFAALAAITYRFTGIESSAELQKADVFKDAAQLLVGGCMLAWAALRKYAYRDPMIAADARTYGDLAVILIVAEVAAFLYGKYGH